MLGTKNVLVVGTGTIGEPLIGLLCHFKAQLGIDEVLFHKRTPLLTDRSKVVDLMNRGARLVTDESSVDNFKKIGLHVSQPRRVVRAPGHRPRRSDPPAGSTL